MTAAPLYLLSSRQQGGTLYLRVRDNGKEYEWPLTPSEGEKVAGIGRVTDREGNPTGEYHLVTSKDDKGVTAEGHSLIWDCAWFQTIPCDLNTAQLALIHWQIAVMMDRYPAVPYLECISTGPKFITLTLQERDGTYSRVRLDRERAGVVWSGKFDGFVAMKRDRSKGGQYEASLALVALPYHQQGLLKAFATPAQEGVRPAHQPQAAD